MNIVELGGGENGGYANYGKTTYNLNLKKNPTTSPVSVLSKGKDIVW